jgi:ABC-type multidrug transport system fused ATPase/permease subunit
MARAMLRRRPILVMDEATASVDYETDERIQTMVKTDFRGTWQARAVSNAHTSRGVVPGLSVVVSLRCCSTVLTIAHRLHTVAFYDRILLLERGSVLEYDTPYKLLCKEGGAFRGLAEESGDVASLLSAAQEAAGGQ